MLHGIDLMARQFLAAQPWYDGLPTAEQEALQASIHPFLARKGEVLLPQGERVNGWYAVLSGLVLLESESQGQRRSAFIGMPDGEWFGEGSALKNEPRRYNVVALRDTWLLCLPQERFQHLHATSLGFNQYLAQHPSTVCDPGGTGQAGRPVAPDREPGAARPGHTRHHLDGPWSGADPL